MLRYFNHAVRVVRLTVPVTRIIRVHFKKPKDCIHHRVEILLWHGIVYYNVAIVFK